MIGDTDDLLRRTLLSMKHCGHCGKEHEKGATVVFGNKKFGQWICDDCAKLLKGANDDD